MHDDDFPRRTAVKLLGLGLAAGAGSGVASAGHETANGTPKTDPSRIFVAKLGPQEGVDTKARGIAVFQRRDNRLTFALALSKIEDTFMTHIHEDEVLGPIAVWLHDFETQDEQLVEGRFSGLLDAGTITDDVIAEGRAPEAQSTTVADLVRKIEAGEAFVNVHTEANPDGELAGRIVPFHW